MRRLLDCLLIAFAVSGPAAFLAGCKGGSGKVLNVYNWPDYIDPAVVQAFEKETGARVNYDTYASNEEMVAKLQAGASGYDVVFPSDYAVKQLAGLNLLREIPPAAVPHAQSIDPRFRNQPFDPENRFSVPFMWGTMGIAWNAKQVKPGGAEPDSWLALFDSAYAGRIAMLDSHRDVIACALKALGYGMNSVDTAALARAQELLLRQKPWVRMYSTDGYRSALIAGEVWLALAWPGDALKAAEENPDIRYTVPKEGTNLWMDNMAIPARAPHPELAEAFIDFLSRPENAVQVARKILYATPNLEAQKLLTRTELGNTVLYPRADVLARSEWYVELGEDAPKWDAVWARIKQ